MLVGRGESLGLSQPRHSLYAFTRLSCAEQEHDLINQKRVQVGHRRRKDKTVTGAVDVGGF